MANSEHLQRLRAQVTAWAKWKTETGKSGTWGAGMNYEFVRRNVLSWNWWRRENPDIMPDLSGSFLNGWDLSEGAFCRVNLSNASLVGANLAGAYFEDANLTEANLEKAIFRGGSFRRADLRGARIGERLLERDTFGGAHLARMNFEGANLSSTCLFGADFYDADLTGANLSGATLTQANFGSARLNRANLSNARMSGANFAWANLTDARLCEASLMGCNLMAANLKGADLSGCFVYGVSAWDVVLDGAIQSNLVIARNENSSITVDNLEVAQFVYLLLNNRKIQDAIETIGKKAVLILGNFKPERKAVLDGIKEALRKRGYLPILFDFDVPTNRDITETVSILAHLSRFIIADITDARSIPQELQAIVPNLPSVPVKPILLSSQREYAMFEHFQRYPQVLETQFYEDIDDLLSALTATVIEPAEAKALELKP